MNLFFPLRATIKTLLETDLDNIKVHGSSSLIWTVQGFGMMRTYLDPERRFRLNVWNRSLRVPNVSSIHDHPWHLESLVAAGRLINVRYLDDAKPEANFYFATIKTGEGGGMGEETRPRSIYLTECRQELYDSGMVYSQRASEIHQSIPEDGTVTLNDRIRVGTGEHARVFWPVGTDWVTAEPRPATEEEIEQTLRHSLLAWFS